MLAAFAIEWIDNDDELLPVSATTVYLRVPRRGGAAYDVREDTLSIGFRATVLQDELEVPNLIALLDRALTRTRRHAAILAGHGIGDELARIVALSPRTLRGAVGVRDAWAGRSTRERGIALMVDTSAEASTVAAELDPDVGSLHVTCRCTSCAPSLARVALARCLAIGLTAAAHTGRYRWERRFDTSDAIDRAGWDVLSGDPDANGSPEFRASAGSRRRPK